MYEKCARLLRNSYNVTYAVLVLHAHKCQTPGDVGDESRDNVSHYNGHPVKKIPNAFIVGLIFTGSTERSRRAECKKIFLVKLWG